MSVSRNILLGTELGAVAKTLELAPYQPGLQLSLHERMSEILEELGLPHLLPSIHECAAHRWIAFSYINEISGKLQGTDAAKLGDAIHFGWLFPPLPRGARCYPDDWYNDEAQGFLRRGTALGFPADLLESLVDQKIPGGTLAQVAFLTRSFIQEPEVEKPGASSLFVFPAFDPSLYRALQESPELLRTLDWRAFEHLLADVLSRFGYEVTLQRGTKDGGVDIFAVSRRERFGPERYLLQAKRWSNRVGVQPVRELLFLHHDHGVTKSCLATTSYFTQGAWQLARRFEWQLTLKDYDGLRAWISEATALKRVSSGKDCHSSKG